MASSRHTCAPKHQQPCFDNAYLYRSTGAACLIAMALISSATSLMGGDPVSRQGVQWSPYLQWTVDNPTFQGNAFDVAATVEFTHSASGTRRRTEMFFVGENTWAFRFTGTRLGVWSFVTSSSDEDLRGHTGEVMIKPNPDRNAHGFLKKASGKLSAIVVIL